MKLAEVISTRSTCLRRQIGALAVRDGHILATGYSGAPRDQPHCIDIGCLREEQGIESGTHHEICRAVHAEQNVICQAAYHGISLLDATLWCTHQPCSICAKLLVNAGISEVYYREGYPDDATKEILSGKLFKL